MSTEETLEQLHDRIITNYEEQVGLLKNINKANDRIIEAQNQYIKELKEYIQNIKGQLKTLQEIVKR